MISRRSPVRRIALTAALVVAFAFVPARPHTTVAAVQSCDSLAQLVLPHAKVTSATIVSRGAFVQPPQPISGGRGTPNEDTLRLYASLPSFCRVAATATPTSNSDITIEVWLPDSKTWNGKFQAVGNGGWAGVISYSALAAAVLGGYASASTDTGHVGNTGAFALGHPEKLIDFGYRAVHEMTVQAKAIIGAYYGHSPKVAFWNGCSQGGRQGLTEAMRYPGDYDAIVAGAPSVNQALLHAMRVQINRIVHRGPDSYIPPERYRLVHSAVLRACDAHDGVKDGVIENPLRCRFDPKVLECKDGDGAECLTAAQIETANALTSPIIHPTTGEVLAPPLLQAGTELGWGTLAGPLPLPTALDFFKYVVAKDQYWDARHFKAGSDIDRARSDEFSMIGLADPNLKPFFDRGGKLLLYHGWSDQQVPAQNTVKYFNDVVRTVGADALGTSVQLYMVPGMAHCRGGAGTDTFDKMAAIEKWVETGRAPDPIIASRLVDGKVVRTRPLCPYGKVARWNSRGSSEDAANFSCVTE